MDMIREEFKLIERLVEQVLEPVVGWKTIKNNGRLFCRPRQVAHWCAYYYSRNTISDAGFWFGRKSHDFVLYSTKAVNAALADDGVLACKIKVLMGLLHENGYSILFPNGRFFVGKRNNPHTFPKVFAEPPVIKEANTEEVKTVQEDTKPTPISIFRKLKDLKERINYETDLDNVISMAKEIKYIESLISPKPVVQHAY